MINMTTPQAKEFGTQPLDQLMTSLGLSNADLVHASTKQLTHKMVQKGRKGRKLTLNAQLKVLEALNAQSRDRTFTLKDLFTY